MHSCSCSVISIDPSNSNQVDPFHGHYEEDETRNYQELLGLSTCYTDPLYPTIVFSDKDIDLSNDYNSNERAEYALHHFSSVQIQSNILNVKSSFPSAIELTRELEDDGEEIAEAE